MSESTDIDPQTKFMDVPDCAILVTVRVCVTRIATFNICMLYFPPQIGRFRFLYIDYFVLIIINKLTKKNSRCKAQLNIISILFIYKPFLYISNVNLKFYKNLARSNQRQGVLTNLFLPYIKRWV